MGNLLYPVLLPHQTQTQRTTEPKANSSTTYTAFHTCAHLRWPLHAHEQENWRNKNERDWWMCLRVRWCRIGMIESVLYRTEQNNCKNNIIVCVVMEPNRENHTKQRQIKNKTKHVDLGGYEKWKIQSNLWSADLCFYQSKSTQQHMKKNHNKRWVGGPFSLNNNTTKNQNKKIDWARIIQK